MDKVTNIKVLVNRAEKAVNELDNATSKEIMRKQTVLQEYLGDIKDELKEVEQDYDKLFTKDWLTTTEVADVLDIAVSSVHNYIRDGRLEAKKPGGKWMIKRQSVEDYAKNRGMELDQLEEGKDEDNGAGD